MSRTLLVVTGTRREYEYWLHHEASPEQRDAAYMVRTSRDVQGIAGSGVIFLSGWNRNKTAQEAYDIERGVIIALHPSSAPKTNA